MLVKEQMRRMKIKDIHLLTLVKEYKMMDNKCNENIRQQEITDTKTMQKYIKIQYRTFGENASKQNPILT
jgi:hypothetical protein